MLLKRKKPNISVQKKNNQKIRQLSAEVAQSVEQRSEKPCVGGSIPPLSTFYFAIIIYILMFLNNSDMSFGISAVNSTIFPFAG